MAEETDDSEHLERRLAQTKTLADFTQRALKGMELDRVLEEVCLATVDVLETDYCDVFELQPEEERLILRAGVGWPDEYYDAKTLDTSPGSQSGYTVETWEPTVVEDIREDERFRRPALFEEVDVLGGVTVVVPGPGQPWGVFGVHSKEPRSFDEYDVTFVQSMGQILSQAVQRARADQKLRAEKDRFESLVSEVDEYAVFRLDQEGYIRSWNVAAERMKGYTEEEILGEHVSILYPEEAREGGRPTEILKRAAEQGGTEGEGWRLRKDGSRFWAHVTINPLCDGELEGFWTVVRDMTDRRTYERELERSEQRYRTLVENFPNGAVDLFDESLVYKAVGGELFEEVGVDVSRDRLGKSIYEAYPDDVVAELEPHYQAALEGERRTFKIELYDRDLLVHTLPVRDGRGEIFAGMAMSQDITERIAYEEKLEESNKQLESFAYAASHDLQEPLRMVTRYLDLVDDRYADRLDEEGRQFLQHAADGAERMSRLIDSLLDYARVATEGREPEPHDADAVLDDALADLELEIEETDAEITVDELPTVRADPAQLAQVFRNLIANALKYSGDKPPRIHVGVEPEEGRWRFSVEDDGVGIAADELDSIFDVFSRAQAHEHGEHGTGIGLAICQQIIDRHGGEMWVESEPGAGSTFFFTMPAAQTSRPPPDLGPEDQRAPEDRRAQ